MVGDEQRPLEGFTLRLVTTCASFSVACKNHATKLLDVLQTRTGGSYCHCRAQSGPIDPTAKSYDKNTPLVQFSSLAPHFTGGHRFALTRH